MTLSIGLDFIGMGAFTQNDSGFDVVLIAGQSNAQGVGTPYDAGIDTAGANSYRYTSGDSLVSPATDSTGAVGFYVAFAKEYLNANPTRKLILVPTAVSATGLVSDGAYWSVGGTGYNFAVAQANEVMALNAGHRFIGVLWHQGESDANALVTSDAYAYALDQVIAGFRSSITGASASWFILGQMVPSWIGANAARLAIDAAHQDTPERNLRCAFWAGSALTPEADGIHYSAAGQRANGAAAHTALASLSSSVSVPGQVTGLSASGVTATSVLLSWTAPSSTPIITDYKIEYSLADANSWTTFSHARSITTNITVTGLTADTAYDFRVSAVSTPGAGTPSTVFEYVPSSGLKTWDSSVKATTVVLSNSDLTAGASSGGSWKTGRASQSRSSGAYYFEILADWSGGTNDNWLVGVMDGTTTSSGSLATFLGGFAKSLGIRGSGALQNGGTILNSPAGFTAADNDVYMFAYDADNGRVWFGRNGTWNASVTPVVGSSSGAIWSVTANTALFPACSPYEINTTYTFTLRTDTATQSYSPPSGFSAWS